MIIGHGLPLVSLLSCTLLFASMAHAADRTIIAEEHYLMADSDTLASAERAVLQRAQRKAIEEAGIYLEATFHDYEILRNGKNTHTGSMEIRTLAAAITSTEILESRRTFENDRPAFFVRIQAVVNLDSLQEAIRRWRSEGRFAEHFRQLQKENAELKAQLETIRATPAGVRTLVIEPPGRSDTRERARTLVETALHTKDLRLKLDLTSQAVVLDPQYIDPLIVRGQTYLRLVSLSYSNHARPREYSEYVDNAKMDFDRALMLDGKNTWALLGRGDVSTWRKGLEEAAQAYEEALDIDPFFDIARHRLINITTLHARKIAKAKQWMSALATVNKILNWPVPDSWIPYQIEAYLLRSDIYQKINQAAHAIEDLDAVIRIDPTHTSALLTRAKLHQEHLQGQLAQDDFERACLLGSPEACELLP